MAKTATVTFRTTEKNKARIQKLAKITNRTAGFFYNYLLTEYLDELEDIFIVENRLQDLRAGKTSTITWDELKAENGLKD